MPLVYARRRLVILSVRLFVCVHLFAQGFPSVGGEYYLQRLLIRFSKGSVARCTDCEKLEKAMKLQVHVLEARGLPEKNRSAVSGVFVRLKMGSTKARTASVERTSAPSWYEDFFFKVHDLSAELVVTVCNGDQGFIGQVKVPIATIFNADKQMLPPSWYALQKRSRKSKTPVTGEICLSLSFYGRSNPYNSQYDSSTISSVNTTPEPGYISTTLEHVHAANTPGCPHLHRKSSSESLVTSDNDAISGKDYLASGKKGFSRHNFVNRLASLFSKKSQNVSRSDGVSSVNSALSESSNNLEDDEELIPLSFFEDDSTVDPEEEKTIPPLTGGVLLDQSYVVSMSNLNAILFKPGSQFVQDLAIVQNTTELLEEPWKKSDTGLPQRVVTYMKAPTKMLGRVKAIEEQIYLRADKGGFVVMSTVSTPDVPFGNNFRTELQFCITPGPKLPSGEKTSRLCVSWRMNFLNSTMMKSMIENGAQQGLKESYEQYVEVLAKHAKCIDDHVMMFQENKEPQSDWELAKEYFVNIPVLAGLLSLGVLLLHIYFPWPKVSKVLQFCYLDLPDTLGEFITSAVITIQLENVVKMVWTFLRARVCRGSDHGVKAQGEGWLLTVTLVCGENLSSLDETGMCDPYVVFTCNGRTRTSSVKLNTLNPEWHEVFEFDATDDAPSTMDIEVFDFEGPFLESESLGYAEINFLKQFPEELADLWVPLQGKHAQSNASRLHLRICLTNTKESDLVSYYIQKVEEEVGKKIVRRSPQQNSTFQRLFSLPPEEFLINDFACAIRRKLHLQGRLFLSPRMLGFYSNIFGHKSKFSILWEDIDEVQEMLPGLGSVGLFFNPSILVFTKKGRAKDAYHYAKSLDAKGRFKFQFQSFVRFGLAYRTIMALWRNRTLSLEQQMEIVANVEAGEADYGAGKNQADDTETFLGLEEANMSEVYSTKLPFTVESLVLIYDRESLDEKIMDKMGCMNYTTPPWEQVGDNPRLQQRQQIYKLNHRLCRFGSHVMRIQQKSMSDDAQECVIAEVFTLHDVPFGDHFQVQVRKEILTLSCDPPMSSCKVFLGVAWQKSTLFQERITRNCLESFTKLLKEELELTIKALLAYKNE